MGLGSWAWHGFVFTTVSTISFAQVPPDPSPTSRILKWCGLKLKNAVPPSPHFRVTGGPVYELGAIARIERTLRNSLQTDYNHQISLLRERAALLTQILAQMKRGNRNAEFKADLTAHYRDQVVPSYYEGIIEQVISNTLAEIPGLEQRRDYEKAWEEYFDRMGTDNPAPRPVSR